MYHGGDLLRPRRLTSGVAKLLVVVCLFLAVIVSFEIATIARFMDSGPAFPQGLLYILLASFPVTLLHELGHAVVAWWLLRTPVLVAIGSTGKLAELNLGQISVSVNALASPARAAGLAEFDASRARALDVLLIALAGPAASLVGVVLGGALLGAAAGGGFVHHLLWAATLTGVFGVLNLIPFEFQERRDGPYLKTDGSLALEAARVLYALR